MHTFKLFGNFLIERDGTAAPILSSRKGCALLAYLIANKRPQSRESVADLLWDSINTSHSLAALRSLLARTRRQIPEIAPSRNQVSFVPDTNTFIDLFKLDYLLESTTDVITLDQGLALYEGDLLADFYLDDAPRFNEWLVVEREKWRQKVWSAYAQVCYGYLEQQNWSAGISTAQRWLNLDPFDESILQYLMQFLANNGQYEQALQQYEFSRRLLWDELGCEPTSTTTQLAITIRAQQSQFILASTAALSPHTSSLTPDLTSLAEPGELPSLSYIPYHRNKGFIGRSPILLSLAEQFLPQDDTRIERTTIIHGMGGLGKTQLAVEFSYRYGRYFPGGVFWISFANPDNVAQEVVEIGGERGMKLYKDADKMTLADRIGRVRQAWQDQTPRLLIFDNCEDQDLLIDWLPVTGGSRVLVTSRRGVWSRDLAIQAIPLTRLFRSESTQFLQELVGLAGPVKEKTADKIAAETGDLPLALYLAGQFLHRYRQITPEQYLTQLQQLGALQHPSLQGHGLTYSPTGHELHISRTFALNFDQLNPNDEVDQMAINLLACILNFAHGEPVEQALLQSCVVENGNFMQELLAIDGLNRLIALGLLRPEGNDKVQIHRLLAEYVKAKLETLVEKYSTAVAQHVITLIKESMEYQPFLAILPIPSIHLQAITQAQSDPHQDEKHHLELMWARHLRDVGSLSEARVISGKALEERNRIIPDGDLLSANLNALHGTIIWEIGDPLKHAWPYYQDSMEIRKRILGDDHMLTAQSLENLGILHSRGGEYEQAEENFKQALAIYEIHPETAKNESGRLLHNMSLLYRRQGNVWKSLDTARQSYKIRIETLDPQHSLIAQSLGMLGLAYYYIGDYDLADRHLQKGWQIYCDTIGETYTKSIETLTNLGLNSSKLGKHEIALHQLQTALYQRQETMPTGHHLIGIAHNRLGEHLNNVGEFDQAERHLRQATGIFKGNRDLALGRYSAIINLAKCLLAQNKIEETRAVFAEAEALEGIQTNHLEMRYYRWAEGDLATAEGNRERAQQLYREALALFESNGLSEHPDAQALRAKFI